MEQLQIVLLMEIPVQIIMITLALTQKNVWIRHGGELIWVKRYGQEKNLGLIF